MVSWIRRCQQHCKKSGAAFSSHTSVARWLKIECVCALCHLFPTVSVRGPAIPHGRGISSQHFLRGQNQNASTQVKIRVLHRLLQLPATECSTIWIRLIRGRSVALVDGATRWQVSAGSGCQQACNTFVLSFWTHATSVQHRTTLSTSLLQLFWTCRDLGLATRLHKVLWTTAATRFNQFSMVRMVWFCSLMDHVKTANGRVTSLNSMGMCCRCPLISRRRLVAR